MKPKGWIIVLLAGVVAVTGVFGFSAYQTVSAAAPTLTTLAQPALHGRGGFGDNSEDLAAALGITVEELNTAIATAQTNALEQAVSSGLITQAQADELASRGAAFPFGGRWGGWLSQNGIDYQALLADALGVTQDELQQAYAAAANAAIDRAVAEGRITAEQADLMKGQASLYSDQTFQSAMLSAFQAAVNQALDAGVITQAQADAILAKANEAGVPGLRRPGGWGEFGGRHGRGGWDGPALEPSAPLTPEAAPQTTPDTNTSL